jgi:hypothetical protein
MDPVKPRILWLADNPGWAYASIVRQVSSCLPGYDHEVHYVAHRPLDWAIFDEQVQTADIVVPMYALYHTMTDRRDNMAMMLTGMRPFE